MSTSKTGNRVANEATDVLGGTDCDAIVFDDERIMPTMQVMGYTQRVRAQLFEDCNDDIVQYFLKSYAVDMAPASGANFLRNFAQVSKTQQFFAEQCLRRNPALSLASTRHSIPEIVMRGKGKKGVALLVTDLLQRYDAVYLNLRGRKENPFIDGIIKTALTSSPAPHLLIDMSVDVATQETANAQNFPGDSKRLEAFIDAAFVLDESVSKPAPLANIDLVLKGRHLLARLIKRLAADGMPPIRKLDLSGVKLVVPNIPFNAEMHRFFVPELLRYLQILMKRGEIAELSLAGMMLMPSSAGMLVSLLCQSKVLSMLDLSGNPLGGNQKVFEKGSKAGVSGLEQLLRSAFCPRILKLSNCGIDDAGATLLLTALQQQPQTLEQLHINGNPIATDHPLWRDARVQSS